jgi:hypothetical protein
MTDQTDAIADLLGQQAIGVPGIETRAVGAQQVGEEKGIAAVGACATLSVARAGALDHAGRNDIHLAVGTRPQKIDHQRVCGFNTDQALRWRNPELVAQGFELKQAISRMWQNQAGKQTALLV